MPVAGAVARAKKPGNPCAMLKDVGGEEETSLLFSKPSAVHAPRLGCPYRAARPLALPHHRWEVMQ